MTVREITLAGLLLIVTQQSATADVIVECVLDTILWPENGVHTHTGGHPTFTIVLDDAVETAQLEFAARGRRYDVEVIETFELSSSSVTEIPSSAAAVFEGTGQVATLTIFLGPEVNIRPTSNQTCPRFGLAAQFEVDDMTLFSMCSVPDTELSGFEWMTEDRSC